jgi:large subunit ribosomal protein L33
LKRRKLGADRWASPVVTLVVGAPTKSFLGDKLMRINILLEAAETGERIYLTSKNRRNTPDRLELKKYSPKLRRVTVFKEVK